MLIQISPREAAVWPFLHQLAANCAKMYPGLPEVETSMKVSQHVREFCDLLDQLREEKYTGSEIMALFAKVAKALHGGDDAPNST